MPNNPVDISGFQKKIKLAQKKVDEDLPKLIKDTATYVLAKLVDEILNGASGTNYPKAYPGSISQGGKGFVGVITSNLRRSIGIDPINKYEVIIRQNVSSLAPYHDDIIKWSENKYGKNFYEITIAIHGANVQRKIFETLDKLIDDVDKGRKGTYSNPF